jgi:hypothetical protein
LCLTLLRLCQQPGLLQRGSLFSRLGAEALHFREPLFFFHLRALQLFLTRCGCGFCMLPLFLFQQGGLLRSFCPEAFFFPLLFVAENGCFFRFDASAFAVLIQALCR